MTLRLVIVDGPLLTRAQTGAIVAAHSDLGVSEAGLVRRVVPVGECGLCQVTHPEDHMCDAKFGALLKQATRLNSKARKSLDKSATELAEPPANGPQTCRKETPR